eukprot:gb/GFBE01077251.1/.p1 GENE.gb/GFBE01077251.1/~~gb/GFBE01077251.1/.p1  ORF type:complete len:279 (+),score=52.13 gb/GFBE01077251.1/:1-837(+)
MGNCCCRCFDGALVGAAKELANSVKESVKEMVPVLKPFVELIDRLGILFIDKLSSLGMTGMIGCFAVLVISAVMGTLIALLFVMAGFNYLLLPHDLHDFEMPTPFPLPFVDLAVPVQMPAPIMPPSGMQSLPGSTGQQVATDAQMHQSYWHKLQQGLHQLGTETLQSRERTIDKANHYQASVYHSHMQAQKALMYAINDDNSERLSQNNIFFSMLYGPLKLIVLLMILFAAGGAVIFLEHRHLIQVRKLMLRGFLFHREAMIAMICICVLALWLLGVL